MWGRAPQGSIPRAWGTSRGKGPWLLLASSPRFRISLPLHLARHGEQRSRAGASGLKPSPAPCWEVVAGAKGRPCSTASSLSPRSASASCPSPPD